MTKAERLVYNQTKFREEEARIQWELNALRLANKRELKLVNRNGSMLAYIDPDSGFLTIPYASSSGGPQYQKFTSAEVKQLVKFIKDAYGKERF